MQKIILMLALCGLTFASEIEIKELKRMIRFAVQNGDIFLLEKFVDFPELNPINLDNQHGYKMLSVACWAGQEAVVEFLLEHGADVNAINNVKPGKFTALDVATLSNQEDIAEYLKTKGAKSFSDLENINNLQC